MQLPFDREDEMRLPGFKVGQDLSVYLQQIRKVVFGQTEHQQVTVVLGNPSCDLDSFISAFVLSYFYNARPNTSKHHKNPIYVPVLNLPSVQKGDLWRLRPEFGVAIRGAFDGLTPEAESSSPSEDNEKVQRREQSLLEQIITIHELVHNDKTLPLLRKAFKPSDICKNDTESGESQSRPEDEQLDVILVDHNAPAIETIAIQDTKKRFDVVGCIDHHVEENYVPKNAEPRIIILGIGSCMSLVADHLRNLNLWTGTKDEYGKPGFQQVARLALAPILVDTWNLKAPGNRVSQLDRDQVAFLQPQTGADFNSDDLFEQVQTAKTESLNLLRMQEIFAHDYKSYVVDVDQVGELIIGIDSVTRDFGWLGEHAKGKQNLVDEICKYARDGPKELEIFGLLTRKGDEKEVGIFTFGDHGAKAISRFEETADVLQLQKWNEDDELAKLLDRKLGSGAWKIWWMGDTSQSRKQVAPLLRDALKKTA